LGIACVEVVECMLEDLSPQIQMHSAFKPIRINYARRSYASEKDNSFQSLISAEMHESEHAQFQKKGNLEEAHTREQNNVPARTSQIRTDRKGGRPCRHASAQNCFGPSGHKKP
jgi:hypothetical protein